MERLGIDFQIADYVEIDKYAVKSFNAIHGTGFEPQDICEWDKNIEVDLIMHGSPCQDFSVAGLQAGGDEGSGTRSSLMYETLRIAEKLKPKYVIWENVKNVLSEVHVHNFSRYLEKMELLGYRNYFQVLNAKDYGIPQNRERVFCVSIRRDIKKMFAFPQKMKLEMLLKDVLEDADEKYFLSNDKIQYLLSNDASFKECSEENDIKQIGNLFPSQSRENPQYGRLFDPDGISPCCLAGMSIPYVKINVVGKTKSGNQRGLILDSNGLCNCLIATDYKQPKQILDGCRIRKITPREYWRLMGFDDADFDKAAEVNSNTQLYKQAGNSIVVNVLEAILRNLLLDIELPEGQMEIYDFI